MADDLLEKHMTGVFPAASLEELQHWTSVMGRAQQMLLEFASGAVDNGAAGGQAAGDFGALLEPLRSAGLAMGGERLAKFQQDFWTDSLKLWERFLSPVQESRQDHEADKDRRFRAPEWRENPMFDLIRQSYQLVARHMLAGVDEIEGIDDRQREQIRFATRTFVDALSPSNFILTNPQVIQKTIETKGDNLLVGMSRMLADLRRGQLTHTDASKFEIGVNIAATPGKVVHETRLYQLIQYKPMTERVDTIPLVIFPPWINRFYILDLNPGNSFIRWAVEQGITVFVVSWKSADASIADVTMDDYVLGGIVDAIDTVRDTLDVPSVHAIGYCVAGTALNIALAWMAAEGRAETVASATFFTAQVDFSRAGELTLLVDEQQLQLIETLSADSGYLDGRYMAATFNLLRGRDLIWSYVVNNYLMGEEYPAFDLLYWNGDTTNLPAKWHGAYLRDLYRDNKLARPGGISIAGVPIDLRRIKVPAYIQAGREDHIAPAPSVWKLTEHLSGPIRFVLAGSGHIAGVVNPPAAGKYGYWINEGEAGSLEAFIEGATEHKGSWWPDWREWIRAHDGETVEAKGARRPGKGKRAAIEDAPGRYVRS